MTGNRGAVLLTTIIVLVFLSTLGMSLISLLLTRTMHTQMQLDRLKALYLAEAGVFKAILELKSGNDVDGDGAGNIPKQELGDGHFWVSHNFQSSTLTSKAKVNGILRVVQMQYNSL